MHFGDCRAVIREKFDWNSFHAVVTDPPYGLGFMGKAWDSEVPGRDVWDEVMHVVKPGGFLVAFGGTRTFHRLMVAIEDSGFHLVDTLCWLYGQGFPKSHNQSGQWEGYGSALKPAWEPIVLAQKPIENSIAWNLEAFGCGALHVDAARLETRAESRCGEKSGGIMGRRTQQPVPWAATSNRWPANVAVDELAAQSIDAQTGVLRSGANPRRRSTAKFKTAYGSFSGEPTCEPLRGADEGGASRFFYCAKASASERDLGCEGIEPMPIQWSNGDANPGSFQSEGTRREARNNHPTVKPLSLMRWLVRLVGVPGARILDLYAGSGTTGMACELEGFAFDGIENDERSFAIAEARIAWARGERAS